MGGRGQKSVGKRERTTEDRFGPMKISPELKALDEYLHNHPDFERYSKIEALESEMSKIIDAKKSVEDTTGNDRLDAIEKELDRLGRYEPYYENHRLDAAMAIGREYTDLMSFTPTANFSKERAAKVYRNAIKDGFNRYEAIQQVKDAQNTVERMAAGKSKPRGENEVTSSTYKRAQKRLQKQLDDWFRR